jgi:hypothetical protein
MGQEKSRTKSANIKMKWILNRRTKLANMYVNWCENLYGSNPAVDY